MLDESLLAKCKNEIYEPDFWEQAENVSGRMSREMAEALPDDMDIDELRYQLSELFFSKFKNNYSMLEACCDIKRNTFQKVLKTKNGRNVTYILLAKFCVGAGLSVSEAKELFSLMGYELSGSSRRDAVFMYILDTHQDIEEFDNDLQKYCSQYKGKSIISKNKDNDDYSDLQRDCEIK